MSYTLQFGDVLRQGHVLVDGVVATVELTAASIAVSSVVAVVAAAGRMSGNRWLRWPPTAYVEATRNTPLLVQCFFFYFALPSLGIRLGPMQAALLALTWNNGAYTTEIVRAGLQSIHRSQTEAGLSLGLSRAQVFRWIVLKPALANVYPALVSQFTLLMLASSVTSAIGAEELTGAGGLIESETLRAFETYITITLIYLVVAIGFRALFGVIGIMLFGRWRAPAWLLGLSIIRRSAPRTEPAK